MATYIRTKTGWKAWIRVQGVTVMKTATRKTDLLPWVEQTERMIRMGQGVPAIESQRRTVGDAVAKYCRDVLPKLAPKTAATHESRLFWWASRIGRMRVGHVTPEVVEKHVKALLEHGPGGTGGRRAALKGGGVSPTTARAYAVALSALYTTMRKTWRWVDSNPVRDATLPRPAESRERVLTAEEMDRLMAACRESRSPYLLPIVELLLATGCRLGEITRLQWRDVNMERRTVKLAAKRTKSRRGRMVPLTDRAVAILAEVRQRRQVVDLSGGDFVFASPTDAGKPVGGIKTAWTAACRRAGIADYHLHDLRHAVATWLFESGVGLDQIGKLLGHGSKSVTLLYSHFGLDALRALLERRDGNGGTR